MQMSETPEHSFRTKTGTCTITMARIVLAREGIQGEAAERLFGKSMWRALAIHSLIGVSVLVFGAWSVSEGDYVWGGLCCLFGAIFLWNVIVSRNNSATPAIERSSIRLVEAHPPRPPRTRGYFVVRFAEGGKERKRLIMLPGSASGGSEEYTLACSMMREAGLLDG
jgi:hypothetical protein